MVLRRTRGLRLPEIAPWWMDAARQESTIPRRTVRRPQQPCVTARSNRTLSTCTRTDAEGTNEVPEGICLMVYPAGANSFCNTHTDTQSRGSGRPFHQTMLESLK